MKIDENGMCALSEEDYSYHTRAHKKKRTNGESIRAMTDAELAEWLVNKVTAGWCPRKASECISNCKMCWTYWLTQEARK